MSNQEKDQKKGQMGQSQKNEGQRKAGQKGQSQRNEGQRKDKK